MWNKGLFLFFCFLFAHLMTEFVFHFKKLWEWEKKSSWGIILHSVIFGILCVILFFPFLNKGLMWWYIIFLSFMHFVIDFFKVSLLQEKKDADAVMLLDELNHIFWFGFVSFFGAGEIRGSWMSIGKAYDYYIFPLLMCLLIVFLSRKEIKRQFKGEK
ncbi:DUF3307 domain-containing protein [bacterium]|nr:DUF3307 domain-containing protein [bacterium]